MRAGKRLAVLALGTMLTLSMAACGGTVSKEDATEKIQAAAQKMEAVESMDAAMYMEMDMSAMGQSVQTDTTMEMSCFNDPMKLKADMTMSMGALGSISMSIFAQENDGAMDMYLYDGSNWVHQTTDISAVEQYDAQESMNLYLDSGTEYISAGTEEINGATADKYTGIIRGDALEEVMKASGATENLESSMGGMVDVSELYSGLGDMPVTVWIDQQSGYPVRYYMDMTDIMQSMMSKAMAGIEGGDTLTIDKVTVTMDCFNFNNVADFEIPAEALDS